MYEIQEKKQSSNRWWSPGSGIISYFGVYKCHDCDIRLNTDECVVETDDMVEAVDAFNDLTKRMVEETEGIMPSSWSLGDIVQLEVYDPSGYEPMIWLVSMLKDRILCYVECRNMVATFRQGFVEYGGEEFEDIFAAMDHINEVLKQYDVSPE